MKQASKKQNSIADTFRLFFTGFTMGAADLVPGVSGGTVAFLLGIYEELIYSIKLMTGEILRLILKRKIKEAWSKIPFSFLLPLGIGLLSAVVSLSKILSFLLSEYPAFVWSFFFGLVIASVIIIRKKVVTWDFHDYAALLITTVATYFLVGAVPIETSTHPLMIFLSGAIAICAMILPGISGSFLLVIMGKYEQILGAVESFDIVTISIFMLGAILGISVFARVLSYLFAKHHDIMIAGLSGFMLGSLRKIWPWKEVLSTRINSHGEIVPLLERNILPAVDTNLLISVILMAVGIGAILLLDKLEVTKDEVVDIHDPKFEKELKKALKSQKSHKM